MTLAIVTASTNLARAEACIKTWGDDGLIFIVENGTGERADASVRRTGNRCIVGSRDYLGSVCAFRYGVEHALEQTDAEIIACLHDDLEIHEPGWRGIVLRHFERHPACGLAGFGGALGLGHPEIYQGEYQPMQLARFNFRSNLVDAEVHGIRSLLPEQVACLDGFSQIGRREFWEGYRQHDVRDRDFTLRGECLGRPWTQLEALGIKHHLYDSLLGAIAKRHGWETWYVPVRCRHLGGQTAVGDQGYQRWAKEQTDGQGDQAFWQQAHQAGYEAFRDVLPLRV